VLTQRQLFYSHLAQTSPAPLALEIVRAEGVHLYDADGREYIDLIAGISVSNVGHRHPRVIAAIQEQLDKYMHLMVYGEYVQSPQVQLAARISGLLPKKLDSVYFLNSGSEAVEGAMKLAKRYTGRTRIASFRNAYHGSTQGSLSIMGSEEFKNAFRPLLPDTLLLGFNNEEDLTLIDENTACVFAETIQGEAGAIVPVNDFLKKLRKRCDETGTLLVLDEIQTGFGRTGKMFAFEHFDIVPDIVCIAKGMGGGMPISAFVASRDVMSSLSSDPVLGHISTFGGHPVCCAASMATINVIEEEKLTESVAAKESLFRELLVHPSVQSVEGKGLLLAVSFGEFEKNKEIIDKCIAKGLITDWFLFNSGSMRIAPPLTISHDEIRKSCDIILSSL
jgi:acetylornithine/succinyldiaminopimelate/putrescine aminotransferase